MSLFNKKKSQNKNNTTLNKSQNKMKHKKYPTTLNKTQNKFKDQNKYD
jgi:hypothetical protein